MDLIEFYKNAKDSVLNSEYRHEVERYEKRNFDDIDSKEFMRCYAWVVLNTGMQGDIIKNIFPEFSKCFNNWKNLEKILSNKETIESKACEIFCHKQKIDSIFKTIKIINDYKNFEEFKEWIRSDPENNLLKLPYIGDVTKYHLGRNLGFDCCKPDRHLVRLAKELKFKTPLEMCKEIQKATNDRLGVIDVVLWRYKSTLEGKSKH